MPSAYFLTQHDALVLRDKKIDCTILNGIEQSYVHLVVGLLGMRPKSIFLKRALIGRRYTAQQIEFANSAFRDASLLAVFRSLSMSCLASA